MLVPVCESSIVIIQNSDVTKGKLKIMIRTTISSYN